MGDAGGGLKKRHRRLMYRVIFRQMEGYTREPIDPSTRAFLHL